MVPVTDDGTVRKMPGVSHGAESLLAPSLSSAQKSFPLSIQARSRTSGHGLQEHETTYAYHRVVP
jgi:hypothetical protein